jgi:hypothetical protein
MNEPEEFLMPFLLEDGRVQPRRGVPWMDDRAALELRRA